MSLAAARPLSLADAIDAALPQTQCTRCGYADCRSYAEAVATGGADINQCPPGGAEGVARLASITGRPVLPLSAAHGTEGPRKLAVIDENWCIGCTGTKVSTSQPPGIYESLGAKVDLGETDSLYLEQLRERLGDKALINIGYLASADINSDGLVNASDWTRFKSGQGMNLAGMSAAQAYSWGDLNGDFKQDLNDFVAFRRAYIAFNGAPAFDQLVAGVPEPSTLWLATLVLSSWLIMPRVGLGRKERIRGER